jgi:hypothetical protein
MFAKPKEGDRDARSRMNRGHEIRKIREGQGLSQRCFAKARQAKARSWTLYRGRWKALVSAPVESRPLGTNVTNVRSSYGGHMDKRARP